MIILSERVSQAQCDDVNEYSAVERINKVLGRRSGACLRSAIALMLALSIQGQAMATNNSSVFEFPAIEVTAPSPPIDMDQWIPPLFLPNYGDYNYGFDPYYTSDGYFTGPRIQCSTWKGNNPAPPGCNQNVKPPPVSVSDPACGPAGANWSAFVPQAFNSSCSVHDVCYSQLWSSKESCDLAFFYNMLGQCAGLFDFDGTAIMLGGPGPCTASAFAFYAGMQFSWAHHRFATIRSEAQCIQWHERKENESTCP